jgi:hypothetical protein
MRFHDFHLTGYVVSDFGATIVLDLVHDTPDHPSETSCIKFIGVAAYHFVHTAGAIITDIAERPLAKLLQQIGEQLTEWRRLHGGFAHWGDDHAKYLAMLELHGYRAWTISSDAGFDGFVIAESIVETHDKT